jgi:hypothetical protein
MQAALVRLFTPRKPLGVNLPQEEVNLPQEEVDGLGASHRGRSKFFRQTG